MQLLKPPENKSCNCLSNLTKQGITLLLLYITLHHKHKQIWIFMAGNFKSLQTRMEQ